MPNDQQVYGGVEYSVTVKWPLDFAFVADGPGPVALTPGMTLGPYETYSATFTCAGVAASGSENDVEMERAQFIGRRCCCQIISDLLATIRH